VATRIGSRGKTRTKAKPKTRATAKRATAKSTSRSAPRRSSRLKESARRDLEGHGADALAIGLVVLAALAMLGLVSDLAGPVGVTIANTLGTVLGRARYAVPVVFLVLAVACFAQRPASSRSLDRKEKREKENSETDDYANSDNELALASSELAPLRVGIGFILLGIAAVGALQLAAGDPSINASGARLRDAGGYTGVVVGGGLSSAAGVVGAAVVLFGFALLGTLLAPGIPMRDAISSIGRAFRSFFSFSGRAVRKFGEMPSHDQETDAPEPDANVSVDLADPPVEAITPVFDASLPPEGEEYDDSTEIVVEDDGQTALGFGSRSGKKRGAWKLPPSNLLQKGEKTTIDQKMVDESGRLLQAALEQHGVGATLIGATVGPTVTRYELELAPGVKVSRVTGLSHDLAYAMAAADVRILAPIPGRSAVGVEVPNKARQLVTLGDILNAPEAKSAKHPLEVGLGRDIAGRPVMLNLAALPHVLIAGATGAGKSSCINSLVTSLLMRTTPDQVRMILVDPKRVELGAYNDVPHLLTPVVTDPKKAANALSWAVREMDLRYEMMSEVGARDITGYNSLIDSDSLPTPSEPDPVTGKGYERLPFIVIVVDELNDLMMVAARDVEASVCRIAQMARAVGIHLVIATQRPSVDVITGVIKANIPSRLAFSVSSLADSRVILDQAGAEKLIGQGDLLAITASSNRAQRIQGAWVEEACVRKVAAHWKRQAAPEMYVEGIAEETSTSVNGAEDSNNDDPLLVEAMELVVRAGSGSTSMLQRKLRVGFSRAGRLIDLLERKGVVGPASGSKAREVLMSVDEFEAMERRGES